MIIHKVYVGRNGGKVVFEDTYILYLTKKPLNA